MIKSKGTARYSAAGAILGMDMATSHISPRGEDLKNVLRGIWVDQMLGITPDVSACQNRPFADKLGYLTESPATVPHFRRAVA